MNLSSSWSRGLLLIAFVLFGSWANAIIVSGIYTGSCERKLGIILGVDSYSIRFLSIEGQFEILPRHRIVQLVSYSLDQIPFPVQTVVELNAKEVPSYEIFTLENLKESHLVSGFPIEFTDTKIAFFTGQGSEVLINKESISHIESLDSFVIKSGDGSASRPSPSARFMHSYAFMNCDSEMKPDNGSTHFYPEQVLTEPLTIKRELDRLEKGFDTIKRYEDEQSFYSKPMLYSSKTRLGMWYSLGSRYGVSSSRTNNFTPILNSEYASDIYDYQRIIATGSQPNPLFEHEEAQSQLYYAFKSSYFHFHVFADPDLLLVGQNYAWRASDVAVGDAKLASTAGLGFGFDHGHWQFGFMSDTVEIGLNPGDTFNQGSISIGKLHLTYTDLLQKFEILSGSSQTSNFNSIGNLQYQNLRINWERQWTTKWATLTSVIANNYNYTGPAGSNSLQLQSNILSCWLTYSINRQLSTEALLSVENIKSSIDRASGTDPKAGISLHLFF